MSQYRQTTRTFGGWQRSLPPCLEYTNTNSPRHTPGQEQHDEHGRTQMLLHHQAVL